MNIYNITKGQLITLWVVGGVLLLFGTSAESSVGLGIFVVLFFGFVVFYTLGWNKNNSPK